MSTTHGYYLGRILSAQMGFLERVIKKSKLEHKLKKSLLASTTSHTSHITAF